MEATENEKLEKFEKLIESNFDKLMEQFNNEIYDCYENTSGSFEFYTENDEVCIQFDYTLEVIGYYSGDGYWTPREFYPQKWEYEIDEISGQWYDEDDDTEGKFPTEFLISLAKKIEKYN